jgi:hypothetical protein
MPATVAVPDEGMTRVVSMPAVVVLPAPLGPSSPKISPAYTERLRSSTALKSAPLYVLVRCSVMMTGGSVVGADALTRAILGMARD